MAAKKPNDKLSKLDKRIASVAPGKKYSDFTPAEKRKYDTNTARYVAELEKQKTGSAKKSSKETVKSASAKGSGKPKYKNVDEAYRKAQLKETKSAKERAKIKEAVKSVKKEATKSVTAKPSTKKVPVKPRGGAGMRGGLGSFGSGSGLRGSVNK